MQISSVDRRNINKNQSLPSQNNKNANSQKTFKGAGEVAFNLLDKSFKVLDKNAMIQVSFVDTISTNIPRTLVDLKTGLAAAFETCRREFSGLFVNCLMPGLLVKGLADVMPKSDILKSTSASKSWANGDIIDKLSGVYKEAQESGAADKTREFVSKSLSSLKGLDGKEWVDFASKAEMPEFLEAVDKVTSAISSTGKDRKALLKQAQAKLAGITKAENVLKFKDKPQANLEETLRDIADLGSKFNTVKDKALAGVKDKADDVITPENTKKVTEAVDKYAGSLKKFVNKKSFIGLACVIGIAVSVQTINRAITRKQFKAEGAPIYKDFGKKDTTQKMDENQKKKFFGKKLLAAAGMYGIAALSMMKKPSVGMFQFSNGFPTMDQCRWIASSTFASRMLAAEDENELRETTVRDIASFSGLYFLGDYVKKGVASGIEKLSKTKSGAKLFGENVVLLNRKKEIAKPVIEEGAALGEKVVKNVGYRAKQLGNWIKNTDLKTASEVANIKTRNARNICRAADIAFSIVMLGILLPKYNRKVTDKKVAAAKALEAKNKSFLALNKENTPEVFKEMIK